MVDPRAKGARAEAVIRDELRRLTGHKWERTPGSGALNEKHGLKGDLYIPNEKNVFCVEAKHYAEDHVTSKILTSKEPQLVKFWQQAIRQAHQVGRKPLLVFKYDRSKIFVAFEEMPNTNLPCIFVNIPGYEFYIALLEQWIALESPKFIG